MTDSKEIHAVLERVNFFAAYALTDELGITPARVRVTVFIGDDPDNTLYVEHDVKIKIDDFMKMYD